MYSGGFLVVSWWLRSCILVSQQPDALAPQILIIEANWLHATEVHETLVNKACGSYVHSYSKVGDFCNPKIVTS